MWYDASIRNSESSRVCKPTVTRADFQQLAIVRLAEAKALLDGEMWDGAYYLSGYAVEVGLKACIIKRVQATDAFLDRKFSDRCYTHDFGVLLELTGLKAIWKLAAPADSELLKNWKSASAWSEQKRYHRVPKREANKLYRAITDTPDGVFQWIQTHW